MKKVLAAPILALLLLMHIALYNIGCSSSVLEQSEKNTLEPPQKSKPMPPKTEETLFTVIETEDLEYPTLAASIRLPFRADPNNTVVLAAKHAYVTTEKHLHVIDVSIPQLPSYLNTLAFPDKIGKVLSAGTHLVVAGHQKLHLIDISVPAQPVLHSTTHLPNRNMIKDMDVRESYLYVLGKDNYSLYIFSIDFGRARLTRAVKLAKRWWLLSPEAEPPKVKQFLFPSPDTYPTVLHKPLLSHRGFLQLHPGTYGIIRSSKEFLVSNHLLSKANNLTYKRGKSSEGMFIMDACWVDKARARIRTGPAALYSTREKYRGNLSEKGKKTFNRQKPRRVYAVVDGKMQQIDPDPLIKTVEVDNKTLEGPATDFQLSGNLLYIVNEKGFFSIFRFFNIEDPRRGGKGEKVMSTTPLQPSSPISIAIGENYACVLATLSE